MFSVFVPGVPRPQGSKKAFNRGGRIVLVEASTGLPAWRQAIVTEIQNKNAAQFQTAVSVSIHFYIPRPKSVKRVDMTVAPDIDKLARGVLDALTISSIIIDDSFVTRLTCTKKYADERQEGAFIFIRDTPHG